MKDSPSETFVLVDLGVNPLADKIRSAVGAGSSELVVCVTPQFTRLRSQPMPGRPPETLIDWDDYRRLAINDLVALGFGKWDETLALIPGEWHATLPKGLVLESITGETVEVGKDYIDDDIRYGCLAYGIKLLEGR